MDFVSTGNPQRTFPAELLLNVGNAICSDRYLVKMASLSRSFYSVFGSVLYCKPHSSALQTLAIPQSERSVSDSVPHPIVYVKQLSVDFLATSSMVNSALENLQLYRIRLMGFHISNSGIPLAPIFPSTLLPEAVLFLKCLSLRVPYPRIPQHRSTGLAVSCSCKYLSVVLT